MKKNAVIASVFLALLVFAGLAVAAGADDPLVSLSYLTGTFFPLAEQRVQERIDASGQVVYTTLAEDLRAPENVEPALSLVPAWTEQRFKQFDRLEGSTGSQWLLLAGEAQLGISAGAVVDVTDGVEISAGEPLKLRHRYLAAEDAAVTVLINSKTAVVNYCGPHRLSSAPTPDYNAIALALRELDLFRGTDVAYGDGFDLESTPTRIQALIMLIRLLGEEDAALRSTAENPFPDVPAWAERYTAYAFAMGYTAGVENGNFAPNREANAGMYTEFVLRALGYSSTAQADVRTAPERGMMAGVLTAGERDALQAGEFLRSDVAYLSWYALSAVLPSGTQTLHERLENTGVFTPAAYADALRQVTTSRL